MKKKLLNIIFIILSLFILVGCSDKSLLPAEKLTIYTVNDFHGAIQEDDGRYGISRLGNYIMTEKEVRPNEVVVLSAGDMFQGTGLSYYSKGLSVIEMMNTIGFDAMTIGNHEFDWGLETILNYRDGKSSNGEANFPILGANILYDDTNELPEYVEPYTIIERGGLTIGIVGYIGYGLEDSIATKMVEDFYFAMPVDVVAPLVTEMRSQKGCDVVIAVGHDASDATNKALANLTGDSKVDAIVNGHLHLESASFVTSTDGRKVPVVQAGSSGECVGVINFEVNQETQSIHNPTVTTVTMDGSKSTNSKLDKYIDKIVKDTEPFFGRVLGVAGEKISVSAVRLWAPNVVQKYMSVDVAFVNSGGIRADAFPINKDEKIDVAKVYQIMPFDNIIKTCELKGSDIRKLVNNSKVMYSSTVVKDGSMIYINGKELDNDTYYTIATVDYLFDKTEYPFLNGQNIKNEGILYRDLLIQAIEETTQNNEKWSPSV